MSKTSLFASAIFILACAPAGLVARAQACREATPSGITERVRALYRLTDNPDTSFFNQDSHPQELVALLGELRDKGFDTATETAREEDREPSFAIRLKPREGTQAWRLLVSKVGKYAALFRIERTAGLTRFISDMQELRPRELRPEELKIMGAIKKHYCLLKRRDLRRQSQIRNLNSLPAPIILWHVLFRAQRAVPPEILR